MITGKPDTVLIFFFPSKTIVYMLCSKIIGSCFNCTYIELLIHLGSLESSQEAQFTLSCASSNSHQLLPFSRACIYNSIYNRYPIPECFINTLVSRFAAEFRSPERCTSRSVSCINFICIYTS